MLCYLEYRENAYFALLEKNQDAVRVNLELAKEIYATDPELLRIEGQYCLAVGEDKRALEAFNLLLERVPDDANSLLDRARLCYKAYDLQQAIRDYSRVLELKPGDYKVLIALVKCCLDMGDPHKAREYLLTFIGTGPQDEEVISLLIRANILLKEKLRDEIKRDPYDNELKRRLKGIESEFGVRSETKPKGGSSRNNYLMAAIAVISFCCLVAFVMLLVANDPSRISSRSRVSFSLLVLPILFAIKVIIKIGRGMDR